jgi:hypothetical protein
LLIHYPFLTETSETMNSHRFSSTYHNFHFLLSTNSTLPHAAFNRFIRRLPAGVYPPQARRIHAGSFNEHSAPHSVSLRWILRRAPSPRLWLFQLQIGDKYCSLSCKQVYCSDCPLRRTQERCTAEPSS